MNFEFNASCFSQALKLRTQIVIRFPFRRWTVRHLKILTTKERFHFLKFNRNSFSVIQGKKNVFCSENINFISNFRILRNVLFISQWFDGFVMMYYFGIIISFISSVLNKNNFSLFLFLLEIHLNWLKRHICCSFLLLLLLKIAYSI